MKLVNDISVIDQERIKSITSKSKDDVDQTVKEFNVTEKQAKKIVSLKELNDKKIKENELLGMTKDKNKEDQLTKEQRLKDDIEKLAHVPAFQPKKKSLPNIGIALAISVTWVRAS